MKLLLLTPQLPYPPRQGTTIRNFYLLKYLAQRHTVDLLSFCAPGEALAADSPLYTLCRRVATLPQPVRTTRQRLLDTIGSRLPDMARRLDDPAMHRLAQQWVSEEGYDVAQVEGIEMAQYGASVAQSRRQSRPIVVFDNHNCEYLLQKRNALTDLGNWRRWPAALYSLIQWQKLRRYEAACCRQADAVLAVSQADRAALERLVPGLNVTEIRNGIDLDAYQPTEPAPPQPPFKLLFTGKMDYRPNIDAVLWFGDAVLPLIQQQEPGVRFQIVGLNPHPRLAPLRANPAVEITGGVPDMRPYFAGATVCVIPMRVGGGTRLKALEAMACAKPIVSTSLGVEGIPVTDGRELLLADTPAAFAAATLEIIAAARQGARRGGGRVSGLGLRARRFVEAHYGWAQIMPGLERVYEATLTTRGQARHTES